MYYEKYKKYKGKYTELQKYIQKSENGDVYVVKPNKFMREFAFPNTPQIDKNNLLLTNVGLYSVTGRTGSKFIIDKIIEYMGRTNLTITDGTANNGSDAIMFGLYFDKVNAIEIDKINFDVLKNNVSVYQLDNKIHLILGDTLQVLESNIIKQDVIYVDAPWGGRGYKESKTLQLMLGETEIADFYLKYQKSAELFVFKVPRNYDFNNFIFTVKYQDMHIYPFVDNNPEKVKFYIIVIKTKQTLITT